MREKFPWKTEIKSSPKSSKKCLIKEKEASTSSRVRDSRRAAAKNTQLNDDVWREFGRRGESWSWQKKKCTHKINAFSRLSRLHLSLFSCVNNNSNFCWRRFDYGNYYSSLDRWWPRAQISRCMDMNWGAGKYEENLKNMNSSSFRGKPESQFIWRKKIRVENKNNTAKEKRKVNIYEKICPSSQIYFS